MRCTNETERTCIKCAELKPITYFNLHDGVNPRNVCKMCQRRYSKEKEVERRKNNKYLHIDETALKQCTRCKQTKVLKEFPLNRAKKHGVDSWCASCVSIAAKERLKNQTAEDRYRYRLVKEYGITFEQKEGLFESQGKKCGACGEEMPPDLKKVWPVDHCHTTGRIRGVICYTCNTSLGMARDSIETLHKLIVYLQNPPAEKYLYNTQNTGPYGFAGPTPGVPLPIPICPEPQFPPNMDWPAIIIQES